MVNTDSQTTPYVYACVRDQGREQQHHGLGHYSWCFQLIVVYVRVCTFLASDL
jgi:hypothetical protein